MDETRLTLHFDLADELPADRKRRWTAFGISSALQPIAVALTVWLLAAPPSEFQRRKKDYLYFRMALPPAPKLDIHTPAKTLRAPLIPRIALQPQEPELPSPVIVRTVPIPEPPKSLSDDPPLSPPSLPNTRLTGLPKREMPPVRTDLFSGSVAVATVNRPAREVQTGGFGDIKGFSGEAQGGSRGNVARLGSFDMPVGPGYGNGSGGSRGARGTVKSVGFGNGIASADSGGGQARSGVRDSGFGDLNASTQVSEKKSRAETTPEVQPVEILSKPNPVYTDEARRLRVQGEVLLEVVFRASGELRVLRLIQGLGHGLDEAALRAAEQIRFRPAARRGQPIDSAATLRIVFQLAY